MGTIIRSSEFFLQVMENELNFDGNVFNGFGFSVSGTVILSFF